ncbi:MAG TPA: signal peptidase I [Acidimicrobiales bacterium]|nr:signal peptidase I [Acidimicrobiales bacterium]
MTPEASSPRGGTTAEASDPALARPHAQERPTSAARTLRELPVLFVVALCIAFVVKTFLAQAFYIPSGSMLPQLQIDDRVVVSKLAYKFHEPRRGDIVVFDRPSRGFGPAPATNSNPVRWVLERVGVVQPSTEEFIKRVVGLPGDTVEGKDGHVFVNGRQLVEPYLAPGLTTSNFTPVTVPQGELWVMGDNRGNSADSRFFGTIDQDTVVGRAVVRVWPLADASFL